MVAELQKKDLELKKHVGSIHCSNTLSLLQRKISNVLLFHAYEELLQKEEHEIPIKTLCQLIGYSSHDYETIKKALKALISTVIEWNLLGDTLESLEDNWNASSILASVGIRDGICAYAYSHRLKQLLYMPEIYGRINIAIQAKFKSNYGLALYENCIRYQNLKFTRWFALATFRRLMGVPDGKYVVFRDFKRRVLDKSVEEVNLYSDMKVEPEIEREGQKVSRIRFKLERIQSLNDGQQETAGDSETSHILGILMSEFSLSEIKAKKLIRQYPIQFIKQKMATVKQSHAYRSNRVHSKSAYFISALQEDYQEKNNAKQTYPLYQANDHEQERMRKAYSDYVSNTIEERLAGLGEQQQELLDMFEAFLIKQNNSFVLQKLAEKGLQNRIVRSIFFTYLREHHRDLLPEFLSFEDFLDTAYQEVKECVEPVEQ